jgi:hypothetical protein
MMVLLDLPARSTALPTLLRLPVPVPLEYVASMFMEATIRSDKMNGLDKLLKEKIARIIRSAYIKIAD